jgi:PGF-pre-PGF domain-containing protein
MGNETEVILDPNDTCIVNINITAAMNLLNVKIAVARLADKPINIADDPGNGTVYEYLNIELMQNETRVSEENLELVTFKFRIKQSWFEDQKINKSSIVFERYHQGKWQDLTTGYLKEDDEYVYYVSFSTGCSTFAVIGSQVVQVNPYETGMPEIPWVMIIGMIVGATILLIVVLFKAGYIYKEEEPPTDKPQTPVQPEPPKEEKP